MRRCDVIALAVLALAGTAAAQPADDADAAYREGQARYEHKDWDGAIAKFKRAYELRGDAASLFEIAESYRLEGDCVQAAAYYRQYKDRFPDANNLATVDQRIASLASCPERNPPPVAEPAPAPLPPAPPPASHARFTEIAGLGIAGAGVVMLGVGGGYAYASKRQSDKVSSGTGTWNQSVEDAGQRDADHATVLLVAGAGALVGGAIVYLVARGQANEAPKLSVAPARGGGSVVWTCGF